jgi:hypothetical protein
MQTVKIVNPAHGDGWTSFKRAEQYVKQGRAVWRNRPAGQLAIRFLEEHPLDATVRSTTPVPAYDGYDRRTAPLTLEEQGNVPLIGTRKSRPVHQRKGRSKLKLSSTEHLFFPLNVKSGVTRDVQ